MGNERVNELAIGEAANRARTFPSIEKRIHDQREDVIRRILFLGHSKVGTLNDAIYADSVIRKGNECTYTTSKESSS